MKNRLILALALIFPMQLAVAQVKPAEELKKAVNAAEAAAANPKKAAKVATWIKLGQAYLSAYDNPTANVAGSNRTELQLVMGNDKALSSEVVEIAGNIYEKDTYADKNLYFDRSGRFIFAEVTKPVLSGDPLAKALEAYKKAAEVDVKGSKTKDISLAIENIAKKYYSDAFTAYYLGDHAKAADGFALAAEASKVAPYSKIDTSSVYYAGVMALESKDYGKAKKYFSEAKDLGYDADGSIYANLSDVFLHESDTLAAKNVLEDGFSKYPENPQVMTSLINLYLTTNENPNKLIDLLGEAKKQMPDNPSLYYVEGDIYGKLKDYDNAVASYRKAGEINPQYEMGYYGEGVLFYNKALAIQEEANALPYNEYKKYQELSDELSETLKKCIEPFEKCMAITTNDNVKVSVADYLKRIYFIFRNESDDYMNNYKKYEEILNSLQ